MSFNIDATIVILTLKKYLQFNLGEYIHIYISKLSKFIKLLSGIKWCREKWNEVVNLWQRKAKICACFKTQRARERENCQENYFWLIEECLFRINESMHNMVGPHAMWLLHVSALQLGRIFVDHAEWMGKKAHRGIKIVTLTTRNRHVNDVSWL